jgi:hypothetical protein
MTGIISYSYRQPSVKRIYTPQDRPDSMNGGADLLALQSDHQQWLRVQASAIFHSQML